MSFGDIVFHYLPLLGREFCQDILLFLRQLNQFLMLLLFFLIKSLSAPLQRMFRHLLDNHFKDFLFVHNGTSFFTTQYTHPAQSVHRKTQQISSLLGFSFLVSVCVFKINGTIDTSDFFYALYMQFFQRVFIYVMGICNHLRQLRKLHRYFKIHTG